MRETAGNQEETLSPQEEKKLSPKEEETLSQQDATFVNGFLVNLVFASSSKLWIFLWALDLIQGIASFFLLKTKASRPLWVFPLGHFFSSWTKDDSFCK